MNLVRRVIEGYKLESKLLDFFDQLKIKIPPSEIFENTLLRKEFEFR